MNAPRGCAFDRDRGAAANRGRVELIQIPQESKAMKTKKYLLPLASAVAAALSAAAPAHDGGFNEIHAVFVMTNDADSNEVIAYQRTPYGTLFAPHRFKTGGRGSGGKVDPLASQGSLTLSDDHQWLFAVNAGSGTLSVFRADGSFLQLTDQIATGGAEPTSVTQRGNLVYVLNAAGSSSVTGFLFRNGRLNELPNARGFLSANGANPGSVDFSSDGKFLVATEKTGNKIDTFAVSPNGSLSGVEVTASAGPGAFAALSAPNGTVLVSETGSGGQTSALSSYHIQTDGSLSVVSASVPSLGAANCWNVVTPNGRFVYASNSGSSSIAGFAIAASGALTPLPGTIVGTNPAGSVNLDIAISADGKFLYSVNSGGGKIGAFGINPDGTLTNLGTSGALPAAAGLNGIAAN
jgi:6-phosphogluconolactonase (cycloisomerase 2 family)